MPRASITLALLVFVPKQLQGDVLLFEFLKKIAHGWHGRFVGSGPGDFCIQALFELAVIDVLRQRPSDPGLFSHIEILSDGDMRDAAAFGNLTIGQMVVEFESQDFFELSHG